MIATCPAPDSLRRYANGEASELESDELTAHVRHCDSCQRWLEESDLDDTLVGSLKNCATVDDSCEFELEPQCQSAMARALGALADVGLGVTRDEIDLPESIGEYRIVRRIGRGGMGSVYLAQHTKLDRTVAVKVLASNRLSDPRMHDRFEKEMRAVGSLSHPNVVTAHDARDVDGIALLVTEWVDGLDLKEIVRRVGPLAVADVAEIGLRVAEALSYIDSQNLVHRDLKPSNVMVNRSGEVKLLDLGLARLRGGENEQDATATGQAMGTADYVAPEQINDAREVDIRADLYGLGCTLYQLLSGRAPFEDASHPTAFAKLTAHVSDPPPPIQSLVPDLPKAVAQLIMQSLSKSPEDRPRSPEEVAQILRQYNSKANLESLVEVAEASQGSERSTNVSPPPSEPATGFLRRRVSIFAAIASGILGLLLGIVFGVLITIEHSDGTTTQIHVPEGSVAAIDSRGDLRVKLPPTGGQQSAGGQSAINHAQPSPNGPQLSANDATNPVADGLRSTRLLDSLPPLMPSLTPPDDMQRLNGIWTVVSAMHYGGKAPLPPADYLSLVVHDGQFAWMLRSQPYAFGKLELDSDRQRLVFETEGVEGQDSKAIYRFNGKELQLCLASEANEDFPLSFEPIRTSNLSSARLQRVDFPSDAAQLREFVQDSANRELLYSLAVLQTFEAGRSVSSLAFATEADQAATQEVQSLNQLKNMALAFHNFHASYGVFPSSQGGVPAGLGNSERPACSWRVAILPFIEHQALYEQYRLDEPWDSEHNLKLLDQMPEIYRRPGDAADSTQTGYVGFSGANTVLGKVDHVRIRDIIDGTSNTLMLIEAETQIPWTKPEDFPITELAQFGLLNLPWLRSCKADGSVSKFEPVTEQALMKAVTINDGSL
ncbi:MAG: protein kinase domain-containing protein [Rubripirellula sp.]